MTRPRDPLLWPRSCGPAPVAVSLRDSAGSCGATPQHQTNCHPELNAPFFDGTPAMRFVIGPPLDSPDFHPETGGWQRMPCPSPGYVSLVGGLIGLPLFAVVAFGWSCVPGRIESVQIHLGVVGQAGLFVQLAVPLVGVIAFFCSLIIVHELAHLAFYPGCGLTSKSVFGVWPSRLMPYADHQGPMPCWRMLLVVVAPFTLLTVVPLALAHWTGRGSVLWAVMSTINAGCCGGDALLFSLLVRHVPVRAVIRNKGWDTWWQISQQSEQRSNEDGGS